MVNVVETLISKEEIKAGLLYEYIFPEQLRQAVRSFVFENSKEGEYNSKGFDTFLADQYSLLYLYVRVFPVQFEHPKLIGQPMIVVANIKIDEDLRQHGVFNQILTYVEEINPHCGVMVECVANEFLAMALKRKGYRHVSGNESTPNLFKEVKKEH